MEGATDVSKAIDIVEVLHHLVDSEVHQLLHIAEGVGGLRWASSVVNSALTRVWPLQYLWPLTSDSLALPPGAGLFLILQHLQQAGAQLFPRKEPLGPLYRARTYKYMCAN